jgi:hypothetical protein
LFGKTPDRLKSGPELRWGLQLYFDAFNDLNTERSHGSGWTRIRWSDVVRYAEYFDYTEDQTDRLLAHIFAMDIEYINKLDADAEAKRGSK